ncbi:MAG: phosphodiesterase [Acetivibrio sp.]
MKYMIASDLHGSAYFCQKMLEAYEREEAEKLIFLGDLLYHGPRNELPIEYNPPKVISLLNERKNEFLCVRGNCDAEVDQMVLTFPILAEYALLSMDGLTVFATHGHVYNRENLPPLKRGDILLHGHTHVQAMEKLGENWYLNPGSLSIPKENNENSYMIYQDRNFTIKNLEGNVIKEMKYEI